MKACHHRLDEVVEGDQKTTVSEQENVIKHQHRIQGYASAISMVLLFASKVFLSRYMVKK